MKQRNKEPEHEDLSSQQLNCFIYCSSRKRQDAEMHSNASQTFLNSLFQVRAVHQTDRRLTALCYEGAIFILKH